MRPTLFRSLSLALTLSVCFLSDIQADTLKKLKDSGKITVGVRESSGVLSYTLGNSQYTGYHVEICQHIIDSLSKAVGKKLQVKYQPVTSQNRVPLVSNGTIDIECGSTTNNSSRQRSVDFANTTFIEEVRMLVKTDSSIKSVADLDGKTVATTTGTTSVKTLRKHKRAQGMSFRSLLGKDHADSFLLVSSGRADVFVMDSSLLAGLVARAKNPKNYKIIGEPLSIEPIAIMMRKDDAPFKKIADDTIASLNQSGALKKIYEKWFLKPTPPAGAVMNIPIGKSLQAVWDNPNNDPAESYAKK